MKEILITKSIQDHWIFQDKQKLGWWLDLVLLADENGQIHMSFSDLAKRWNTSKPTICRFLTKLNNETVCETIVKHQTDRIMVCKSESYKVSKNEVRNDCETPRETPKESPLSSPSLSSPTPPSITPPIIPQEDSSSSSCAYTHVREEDFGLQVGVIATIEKYAEQYKSEGMWRDVAAQNHIKPNEAQEIFKSFVFDQKHNATDYANYSDFKRHFLNYVHRRASAMYAEQQSQEKPKKVISGKDIFDIYK